MRAFFALMWTKILYISTSIVMSTIYLEEEVIVATLYIHFVSWKHFLLISPSPLFLRLSSFTEMRSVWQFFLHKKTNSMLVRDLISPLDRLWKNESFSQNCCHGSLTLSALCSKKFFELRTWDRTTCLCSLFAILLLRTWSVFSQMTFLPVVSDN